MRVATSGWPTWSSIMQAARIWAVGFATFWPAMSGAEPWTGSYMQTSSPMFPPGAMPRPPTSPAMRSLRMSPNMFSITSTSNR